MSQKYSAELEKILEELREDIGFYHERFEKTNSRAEEIRYKFLVARYYEILSREDDNEDNRLLHQRAKENYEGLFEVKDVFPPNRKA